MNSFVPQNIRPTVKYFQFSFVFLTVIMIGLNLDSSVRIPAWLEIPLMLYWFWSAFYIFMFAARMLKSVTEGELVNRSDSFGTFLYLIFIPWGMWSIQKQIHLILANQAITMS
jgi:hypothetical protein